ncbi:MAG: acyl-protein synthetase [Oscillospiraceae bacterium]|jgi:phenylacetate-coenzyme A ligase PaaK-like adenylate-forming protein|nr:acyl-protein synthetase [Oscillospiraceae bacterium]
MDRNLYNLPKNDPSFFARTEKAVAYHAARCEAYEQLLERAGYTDRTIRSYDDLYRLPSIPTLFLKNHQMYSTNPRMAVFKATTSGTSGKKSVAALDLGTCLSALKMVARVMSYYGVISPVPVNYVVLGYQPNKSNELGVAKTAFGATLLAPALRRKYAIKFEDGIYTPDIDGTADALFRFSRQPFPVRIFGFPAYLKFLLDELHARGIRLTLPKNSGIYLAGGWKQFAGEQMSKPELFEYARDILGVPPQRCYDFYGAVEHPILYASCKCNRFHVPIYSRVLVRDAATLEPVPYGTPGLASLISPLVKSMPLVSVMTDDLLVMHEHCDCGIPSPCFEILGRASANDLKTCAASAAELLSK